MHAHRQIVCDHGATGRAALRRPAWINLTTYSTSLSHFVLRVGDELIPVSIRKAFCQTVVLDHPGDAQVLKDDDAKLGGQSAAQFVGKVLASVGDLRVDTPHNPLLIGSFRCLFGVLAHSTLRNGKRLLILAKEAGIGDLLTGRERREHVQANIDPDRRAVMLGRRHVSQLTRYDQVPLLRTTREHQCLDRPVDWTMHDDPDLADVLEVDALPVNLAAIPVGGKLHRSKTIVSLEAWIARLFAPLQAPKEGLKRLVQAAQDTDY